jgi:hypothetical protein
MTTLLKGAPYPSLAATADTLQPTEHDTPVSWNAWTLKNEMAWFCRVLETRLQLYFKNDCEFLDIDDIPAPDLIANPSEYGQLVQDCQMNTHERMVLILTLIPHLQPQLLNLLLISDPMIGKPYVEFGGWRGNTHTGFLPTAETAAFIIAGNDLAKRLDVFQLFNSDHFFTRLGILNVQPGQFHEAYLTAPLVISREYLNRLTIGQIEKPDFSMHFPAKLLETPLHWEDLVLPAKTRDDVAHIQTWLQHHHYISCKMGFDKSIKPGYRALFYGPPGTGKTLTASLLGKVANMDVYRIELSSVVSKFIGETEKNLEAIFRQAENRNWILFFDEADALFGKRSETQSSNDRYANQEVAYLLQRIEDFPGVVILASNLKSNIDDAFLRRFQSMVYFPMPDIQDRLKLWQKALGDSDNVADDVDLGELARQYDMAGGAIINVIRYAAIATVKDGREKVEQRDLVAGIIKEQRKQGKLT